VFVPFELTTALTVPKKAKVEPTSKPRRALVAKVGLPAVTLTMCVAAPTAMACRLA
jgi:hypothetical protein